MLTGVLFAMAAGLMWGLVFVGPLLLPEYPAALHTFGRYLAFGLIALPLAFADRAEIKRLTRADWLTALKLAAIGNVLYYLFLASALQRAGGALPTMVIGTLPLVIAISANLLNHRRDGRFPWLKLAPPLALEMRWS
jgi:drug/metabolite transporter (DMT)-like permease